MKLFSNSKKQWLIITVIYILMSLFTCYNLQAKEFTKKQTKLLHHAFNHDNKNEYPETIQGILLQESKAGKLRTTGSGYFDDWRNDYYGVMQIKFTTAKWIIRKTFDYDMYGDVQLLLLLINNNKFNIQIGTIYFKYLMKSFDGNWKKAVLAYNVGPGKVRECGLNYDPNKYVNGVNNHIKTLRSINFNREK